MSACPPPAAAAARGDVQRILGRFLAGRAAPGEEAGGDGPSFGELGLGPGAVLELLVEIEDALGVAFEDQDLTPASLRSPRTLQALVEARAAAAVRPTRKRVAHLTSSFLPHLSGPQRMISDIHEQLGEWLDDEVYSLDRPRGLAEREVIGGLSVSRFHPPRPTDLVRLRARYRRVAAHPDLDPAEVCSYDLPSTQVLATLRRARVDAIVTYFYSAALGQHLVDFFPATEWVFIPSFFQAPGDGVRGPLWDPARVDKLLLFQEHDRAAALAYGVPARKITVLPLPVNTERFRPRDVPRDPDTLLYVGRLMQNKGLRAFLETFQWMLIRRPSLRLRLVADLDSPSPWEREERGRLRTAVERLGLEAHVQFAGRKEGDALAEEYSRAAIHVLPSIGDCYSLVTLEALACGMTCVNLDNPRFAWQRRLDGGQPLVHLCPTLPAMGERILGLLESGGWPDHRPYVVEHLSWQRYRDAYREFFLA